MPSKKTLSERAQGYLFHQGQVTVNILQYIQKNALKIVEANGLGNTIKGSPACTGKVQGKVKVVFELSDLKKVAENDILITPMTTPDMMVALQKAAAVVTDEGGVTCHAAIIARELKKPCIIGTKIATSVLKDGDIVEVDATKGIVKVLSQIPRK